MWFRARNRPHSASHVIIQHWIKNRISFQPLLLYSYCLPLQCQISTSSITQRIAKSVIFSHFRPSFFISYFLHTSYNSLSVFLYLTITQECSLPLIAPKNNQFFCEKNIFWFTTAHSVLFAKCKRPDDNKSYHPICSWLMSELYCKNTPQCCLLHMCLFIKIITFQA